MSGGGGGSGNDGSNDTQVSGAEAFYSNEPGVSTHAESKVTKSSGSGAPGGGDSNMYYDAPDTSMVGKGGGNVDAEDEYLEPDKDHWKATQKAIGKTNKELSDKGLNKSDWTDLTKEQQDAYQLEMNRLKGTEGKRYSFYQGNEGTTNLSFGEHWKDSVVKHPALKFSPLGRFLYTAGKTLKENATTDYGTWKYGAEEGTGSGRPVDGGGWFGRAKGLLGDGDISTGATEDQREGMNIIAPEAPYIISGIQRPTDSPAAQWYQSLGNTSTNQFQFSFANELSAAKAKQASILGNQSAVGWLAVNQSPFYNFLKERKLDKGIL